MNRLVLAGCVITDAGGRILLLHRRTAGRVQWEIPGGKIDAGEDARAAAVREVREEVGVDVVIVRRLGEKSFEEDSRTHEVHLVSGSGRGRDAVGERTADP
ncbi:NUDIX hydrolase [Catenuloplanes atrovinosus]|uniref:8-oxo-dGTP pyrophosphatase MutT (NUDIX family) n=1 Tax=Catenuloplanes atrovinosus TaxID=137266 RepID=A0AAE4CB65_9ACTN|nr:NUDIX domain-containing protein [Catenuloplanes atrovinosus]MDR7277737.1 8-oxo-dGTP pyrophosphatase MutT (NUDIX family) [Catenuloplanes atrovinosus]